MRATPLAATCRLRGARRYATSLHSIHCTSKIHTIITPVKTSYSCFHSFDYAERLSLLGLKRLEERRIRADLLFAYKLLFGFTPLNVHEFFTPSRCTGTRGHAYKLFLTRCTTDVRKHFFCNRVAKIWNQLPSNTDFTSITSFRRALNGFDLNAYCDC